MEIVSKNGNVGMYMRVGNIEQLDYYIDEKIENKKQKKAVALYMRTNRVDGDMVNADIYSQRNRLEEYCKKQNIINRVHYIDVRKNGLWNRLTKEQKAELITKYIDSIEIEKNKEEIIIKKININKKEIQNIGDRKSVV